MQSLQLIRKLTFMKFVQGLVLILFPLFASAQPDQNHQKKIKKGAFYFAWGYNKDWYSRSDLHFSDHTNGKFDFPW